MPCRKTDLRLQPQKRPTTTPRTAALPQATSFGPLLGKENIVKKLCLAYQQGDHDTPIDSHTILTPVSTLQHETLLHTKQAALGQHGAVAFYHFSSTTLHE